MKKENMIVIMICVALFILGTLVYTDNPFDIDDRSKQFAVNQEGTHGFNEKRELIVGIPENLLYLAYQSEEKGFLIDYLNAIFEPANIQPTYIPIKNQQEMIADLTEGRMDCAVVTVNEFIRRHLKSLSITKPLMEIRNSIFLSSNLYESANESKAQSFSGVIVNQSDTIPQGETISYNDVPFKLSEASTVEEAINLALQMKADGIIGDEQAISIYLRNHDLLDQYTDLNIDLGGQNVCLIVNSHETTLYDTINQEVQEIKSSPLVGQLQSKWFGFSYSLQEENRFEDFSILLLVVFLAVLSTFFLYYLFNKNLYKELTERMEQLTASKREMSTTFNGVSYYMAELDPKGIVIDVNKAFLMFIKQMNNNQPIGFPIWNTLKLPEESITKLQAEIEKTTEKNKGQYIELSYGKTILDINTFPIENSKGKIEKILFMASDVTGIRMAERQMLQNNKMIAVGQLAAGVAHEIRNPLGLIRNYCYVLKNMNPEDEAQKRQAIQIIEKSVETASKIITNLLNFSRMNTMEKERIYVRNHIDSVVSLNYGKLKKKQIKIYVNCIEDFIANICVEALDMVLINLLSNAMDAIQESGKITIDIYKYEDDFGIIVTDTGEGMEEEILKNIYNPFFTTKKHGQGNGLGLYIVYNEVHKMNGTIDVFSTPNIGTSFKIILPLNN
ncbi:ATP-binding protein [Clostridium aminobutyricum]|uniref:histidine kinase n=1 Tax=Clostridium aminobutyricum TaxID=33953 RepID=A0A939II34_CLOAM|nr:ATP-binding protein [Clostridium aminobutyricum]MBN7772168.1 transporter substrate-binding domain-containing protein [Clostridium aminobutyricum]